MKKSVKALLWSGLVFPGTGHFYLKRYQRGLLLFVPAVVGIGLYLHGLIVQIEFVLDKMESGAVPLDPVAIEAMIDSVPQTQITDIAFWLFVLCWGIAMVDSYLLGAKLEQGSSAPDKAV